MKIALECHSNLLSKALYLFLKPFIVPLKQCEFIITDRQVKFEKPTFYIGTPKANLSKPFSKEALYKSLQNFCNELDKQKIPKKQEFSDKTDKQNILEQKITLLTEEFTQKLVTLLREHYEK